MALSSCSCFYFCFYFTSMESSSLLLLQMRALFSISFYSIQFYQPSLLIISQLFLFTPSKLFLTLISLLLLTLICQPINSYFYFYFCSFSFSLVLIFVKALIFAISTLRLYSFAFSITLSLLIFRAILSSVYAFLNSHDFLTDFNSWTAYHKEHRKTHHHQNNHGPHLFLWH